jgi:hypothetical protein
MSEEQDPKVPAAPAPAERVSAPLLVTLAYLPHVISGVVAVQGALKGAPGATKKAAVLSAITAANRVAGDVPEEHVQLVSALIDASVAVLKATGKFN